MANENNARITWVDNGKAIAVLLIVCLHIPTLGIAKSVINSFVIPYFFFLSGITFKLKEESFFCFCKRKIRTLVIPAIILGKVVLDLLQFVYSAIIGKGYSINVNKNLIGVFLQMRGGYEYAAWFLICLFSVQIIVYVLLKYILKSESYVLACSGCFFIVGCAYSLVIHKVLPWSLDVALIAVSYILLGVYIREKGLIHKLLSLSNVIIYLFLFIVGNVVLVINNEHVDMWMNQVGNPVFMLMTTVGGAGCVSFLCDNIKNNFFLDFFGKNSMIIYCLHYFPIYILDSMFEKRSGITVWGIYFIFTVILTGILTYIIRNYLPFLAGMNYKKKRCYDEAR